MTKLTKHQEVEAHEEGVWSVAWIPGSRHLLTGSVDESVKRWEVGSTTINQVYKHEGHMLGVVSVDVHATGQYAASSSLDSMIRVWETDNTENTIALIETAPTETWSVAFGPQQDAMYLAVAGGTRNTVVLWRLGEGKTENIAELSAPPTGGDSKAHKREQFVLSAVYSNDGSKVAAGCMDGTVAIWDAGSGKLLGKCEGHHKPVRCVRFNSDNRTLLTACDDMHIHLYDVESCQLIDAFSGHESWVLTLAVHPTKPVFASGGSDAKVKLWDLNTRQCIHTEGSEHTDQVWGVSFTSDGEQLASVSDDKKLVVYNVGA